MNFHGMRIISSPHVPKKNVPVRPFTDDMRAMVAQLIDLGEASPQFRQVDQVIFMNGSAILPPNLYDALRREAEANTSYFGIRNMQGRT